MAIPKSHRATERLAQKVYEVKRRTLLKNIGITEKQLDEVFEKAVPRIKKELNALVRYSDKNVVAILQKHLGGMITEKREAIIESMIEEGAKGGRIDKETFNAVFGESAIDNAPLKRQLDLARRGQRSGLHLVVSEGKQQ